MSRRVAKSTQPLTLMTRTAVSLMLAVSTALSVNLTATALGVGMVSLSLGTTAQAKVTATDFSDLVSQVTPGVARVNVTKEISHEELAKAQTVELLRQFFGNRLQLPDTPPIPAVEHAYGTAFFVTKDGYMLTNHHVIEGADTITVTLSDRRELDAKLIGSDERSDVAVLKVEGNDFPALPLGDSNAIKVGESVLAIGSPFGFDYSASAGIVSSKSRNFSRQASVPFIQTDVALNPGNSGGPLFNRQGQVIGINSRIFSGTGGYMGLSFSIPIDAAMNIYAQLKDTGEVKRAYFGVYPQDIDRNLAEAYGLALPQGALVTQVSPESPASKAGLKRGDVIIEYNGERLQSADDFVNKVNQAHPNDRFDLLIQRNKKPQRVYGTLSAAPSDMQADDNGATNNTIALGIRLRELTRVEAKELQAFRVDNGVLITAVTPTGLAARSGLQAGDVITNLHQKPITSIADFIYALESLPTKGVVTIEIIRNGIPAIIGLRIED